MARDYYEVLGVSRDADPDELQQAYRRLARAEPPRREQGPGGRGAVQGDQRGLPRAVRPGAPQHATTGSARTSGRSREDWEQRVGAGGPGRSGRPSRSRRPHGLRPRSGDFGDGDFGGFGGCRGHRHRGPARRHVRRRGAARGPDRGRGPGGRAPAHRRGGLPRRAQRQITLDGPGGPRTYTVTIPPGVTDGQRIRLAGEGGRGCGDGPAGDLYLVVRILPHPRFRVRRPDITSTCRSPRGRRRSARRVPVATPGWRDEGDRPGRLLDRATAAAARARACPDPAGTPGDLFAEVKIMVPPRLTDRERELFAELAASSTFDPRRDPTDDGADDADETREGDEMTVRYLLVRPATARLGVEEFARALRPAPRAGAAVRRARAAAGRPARRRAAVVPARRSSPPSRGSQRLHAAACPLNYAALGLVIDLLDRIRDLETTCACAAHRPVRPRTQQRRRRLERSP